MLALRGEARRIAAVDADLSGSEFVDVALRGAVLRDVNLSGAVIEDADLSGCAIVDCRVEGMTIDGVLVGDLFAAWRAARGAG